MNYVGGVGVRPKHTFVPVSPHLQHARLWCGNEACRRLTRQRKVERERAREKKKKKKKEGSETSSVGC